MRLLGHDLFSFLAFHNKCLPLTKKSGDFGWTFIMVRPFRFAQLENFQNERNVLRASPKFPTGISKRKIVFHLLVAVPGPAPIFKLVADSISVNESELHNRYMLISKGISYSGGFACHLHLSR